MNREYIASSTLSHSSTGGHNMSIPKDVMKRLGGADKVAWFWDEENNCFYLVRRDRVVFV